eukprot:343320-Pyramimonas_sp.AAC.1
MAAPSNITACSGTRSWTPSLYMARQTGPRLSARTSTPTPSGGVQTRHPGRTWVWRTTTGHGGVFQMPSS